MPPRNSIGQFFGRFAIPDILRILAGFHLLVFALTWLTAGEGSPPFTQKLAFDRELFLAGEYWRLFTFPFIPRSMSMIWILFTVLFMWMINDGLEQAWGSAKLNLYLFVGWLGSAVAVLLFGNTFSDGSAHFLFETCIIAFAIFYPNHEIMLFLIIPVKMKWIGLLSAAFIVLMAFTSPIAVPLSVLNLIIFFLPGALRGFQHRQQVAGRRKQFEGAMLGEDEAFHTCASCGKTDLSDPGADFRITDDDEELCDDCLE